MYTFGQLKTAIRGIVFPTGEAENLVAAHDKILIDALIDLQRIVKCLQRDNTDQYPQCSTLYNCGLTVFDAPPHSVILSVSTVDRINPETHQEDPESPLDWCLEIHYRQVEWCQMQGYLNAGRRCRCSLPSSSWFGFLGCNKSRFPVPTDEGLPAGLPILPLGYHYPQESTNRSWGRSPGGVWALDRGKIYVAPWIQSTESVIVRWDGIKRSWTDTDPIDPDPQLALAVEEYLRWKHAGRFDHDPAESQRAESAYLEARQMLWHDCEEENRVRDCEGSKARAGSLATGTLYFNEEQSFTAQCQTGQTGSPVTITIPSGTIGSNVSVADANAKAKSAAQEQAEAQLVCTGIAETFTNNVAGDYTARCSDTADADAPAPSGNPVRVTVPIGTVSGATQDAANAAAQAQAEDQAKAGLSCTYYNSPQSYTAHCSAHPEVADITKTIAAGTYNAASQSAADALAMAEAQKQAVAAMSVVCTGAGNFPNAAALISVNGVVYFNGCTVNFTVIAVIPAGSIYAATQADANNAANAALAGFAQDCLAVRQSYIMSHWPTTLCQMTHGNVTYPPCTATWPTGTCA